MSTEAVRRICQRAVLFSFLAGVGTGTGTAQETMPEPVRLLYSDAAVLEAGETRKDIPCTVTAQDAQLEFDLKYHARFTVTIPYSELQSNGRLTVIFRVMNGEGGKTVHFVQKVGTGPVEAGASGDGMFSGGFEIGPGNYKVEWMMRDGAGRVCSAFWTVKTPSEKNTDMVRALKPGEIQAVAADLFRAEEAVAKTLGEPVKVFLNWAPAEKGSAVFRMEDQRALVEMLRNIVRDQRIGEISLVVYNLEKRRILYRQSGTSTVDFPALGEAVTTVGAGTIDIQTLNEKEGESRFLRSVVDEELGEQGSTAIFLGPPGSTERAPDELKSAFRDVNCRMFYMSYTPKRENGLWADSIGQAVQSSKGRRYAIQQPKDLLSAWPDIISRMVR